MSDTGTFFVYLQDASEQFGFYCGNFWLVFVCLFVFFKVLFGLHCVSVPPAHIIVCLTAWIWHHGEQPRDVPRLPTGQHGEKD